jgi:hypothetical protein
MSLRTVRITLMPQCSGPLVREYRGVHVGPNSPHVIHLFTHDYLDPTDWEDTPLVHVVGFPLSSVQEWVEADHDGPPLIVLPDDAEVR